MIQPTDEIWRRFWSKVNRGAGSECWEWTACRDPNGYGGITIDGKRRYAHRLSLKWHIGRDLGKGLYAIHSCDNPPCVNPAHLREGTPTDNNWDMIAKGRYVGFKYFDRRGEKAHNAVLNEDLVRRLRREHSSGRTVADVSRGFGISYMSAWSAICGKTWAHVSEDCEMRTINCLVCHHSASEHGTVESIDAEHKAKGWSGIGYHAVVYPDGSLHLGRPEAQIGASVYGANDGKLAICLIGDFTRHDPTPAQWDGLGHWLITKILEYNLRSDQVRGHREVSVKNHGTLCPGSIPMKRIRAWCHVNIPRAKAGSPVGSLADYMTNKQGKETE